jgi:hypothetical protein
MCILFLMFSVSATVQDTKNVTLAVVVPQVYELKISDASATTVSGFNTADAVSDVVFEYGEYDSDVMYALIKTNDPGAVFVALTLVNLKSAGKSTEIGYEIWVDDALLGTSDTAGVVKTMVTADVFAGHGLRVVSVPFYVRLVDDDVWNAMVATYTANIAFTLQSP